MPNIKKEGKIARIFLIVVLLLVFILSFTQAFAGDNNATIDFYTDKESYDVGEEVVFKGEFFINGVRVLSVPSTLKVVDPLGETEDVEFQGHSDGTYRGSFEPEMEGLHSAILNSKIAGVEREREIDFSVIGPGIDFDLEIPDEIIYGFGPVDIEGEVSIERDSRPLNKNIRLMKRASSDQAYTDLCDFECEGSCSFSCSMGTNIKLTDYEIIARTSYDGVEQIERTSFSLVMDTVENLNIWLEHERLYLDNETQIILINATYEDKPLKDAKVNLKVETPENDTVNMVADELSAGQYFISYAAPIPGDYDIEAVVSKDSIYGVKESNFTVVDSSSIITPEAFEAVCVDSGRKWRFSPFNATEKSMLSTSSLIDGKTNISSAYLLKDNEKELINATESLIDITYSGMYYFSVLLYDYLYDDYEKNLSINYTSKRERIDYEIEGMADYFRFSTPEMEERGIDFIYSNGRIIKSWREDVIYTKYNGSIYTKPSKSVLNLSKVEHADEILQEEVINLKPVYDGDLNKSQIKIFSPDGEKIVEDEFGESYDFETTNETLPGEYLYILTSYSNETAESVYGRFMIYSAIPDVEIHGMYNESVMRGTELELKHKIKNNNYRDSDIIRLDYSSSFVSVDFYKGNEKLNDSNNDGYVDTGKISPGESIEIKARVQVPSDVVIGSKDEVNIIAISSKDTDKNSTAKNTIKVVAFEEEDEPEYRDALELLSIENYQGNLRVNIRNHFNESKIARLRANVDYGEGRVQEGTFEHRIIRDNIQSVIVPKKYPDAENFTAQIKLVDNEGEKLEDEIDKNKNKTLYHYPGWHIDSFEERIPVPVRETLGTSHDDFIVRVYLDFNQSPEYIVPVIQTGNEFRTGNYKKVIGDDKGGFFMLHFEDIPASSETYAYVYFGDEKTSIDYENSQFEYEKIITNNDAITTGRWVSDRQIDGFYGADYLHDLNSEKGWKTVRYEPNLPLDNYELYKNYPSDERFANQVPVLINTKDSTDYIELNQRVGGGRWNYIGSYTLDEDSYITIGNYGTRGIVVADSIRLEKVSFYSSANPTQQYSEDILKEEPKLPASRYELNVFNKTELDMSEFFTDLDNITYTTTAGIEVELINRTALLKVNKSGQANFTDQLKRVDFDITKTNETLPEEEIISIPEDEEKREWHRAVVNQPVRWNLTVSEEEEVAIPIEADNLEIFDREGRKVEPTFVFEGHEFDREGFDKLMQRKKLEEDLEYIKGKEDEGLFSRAASYLDERAIRREIDELGVPDVNIGNRANVKLPSKEESYKIRYETPAPKMRKGPERKEEFQRRQDVTVYSNASVHYENVLTTVNITPAKKEQISLYWEVNDTKVNVVDDERFNVEFIDDTGDGLVERLQWTTPRLSEQNFEVVIDLAVLNVQSYPSLHHNWTVDFNTTGTANLTITAVNDTTWSEFLIDSSETDDDLDFIDLTCGEESVKDELYVIREDGTKVKYSDIEENESLRVKALKFVDWQCDDKTAHIYNKIITTGEHHLRFEFGDKVAYAHNYGFLLYEDFESYDEGDTPYYWVDFFDAYEIVSEGDEWYYRGDAIDSGERLVAEYNLPEAYGWSNYEVRTRMRITEEDGEEPAHGIYLYSDYEEGELIRIFSDSGDGEYRVTVRGFDMIGDLNSGIAPGEGEWYDLRAQVKEEYVDREHMTGNTTVVYAKIWESGTPEPEEWQIDAYTPEGVDPVEEGSIGFVTQDAVSDFDYITVEDIDYEPELTIDSPVDFLPYSLGTDVWFNVSMDKTIRNCTYSIDGGDREPMHLKNSTYAYANQTFGDFGTHEVEFFCDDYHGHTAEASITFEIGESREGTFLFDGDILKQYSFEPGTFTDTYLDEEKEAILLNETSTSGSFESQVIDTGVAGQGRTAVWENIDWGVEDFGELPNYGESDSYADMTGNVLLFHMNEGSGPTIYDSSGNDNHGTAYGGLTYGFDSARESLNTAIDFDGDGGYIGTEVDAGDLGIDGNSPKTVSAWAYTREFDDAGAIFSFGGPGSDGEDFALRVLGDENEWRGQFWGDGNDVDFTYPSLNTWVHFVVVYTGSDVIIYADGEEQASSSQTLDTSTEEPFRIGWWSNRGESDTFDGMIDEVAVWDRALSAEEVEDLYYRTAMDYSFSVRSCGTEDCSGVEYQSIGNEDGELDLSDNRYIQYLFETSSAEEGYSAELYNVTFEYREDATPSFFYDDFKTTDKISDSTSINFHVTEDGGAQLASECLDYPFEPGCWQFRKKIEVTETENQYHFNYTFPIDFDGKSLGDRLQDNCEDLRITFVNSTGNEEEVYYWPEDGYCDSSESRVWVKAPHLDSGETHTFYMYYGYSDADPGSYEDGNEVFDFFDDFSDGSLDTSKWDEISTNYNFPGDGDYIEYWGQPIAASVDEFSSGTLGWRMFVTEEDGSFEGSIGIRNTEDSPSGYYFMTDTMTTDYMGIVRDEKEPLVSFAELSPQGRWLRAEATFLDDSYSFWTDFHQETIVAYDDTHTEPGRIQLWSDAPEERRAGMDWVFLLERTTDSHSLYVHEEESYYEENGKFSSVLIEPELIQSWGYISPLHYIPENTNLTYGVKDENDNILCEFEASESLRVYDISGCAFGKDSIKIFAQMHTDDDDVSPLIHEWEVSWSYDLINKIHEPTEIYHTRGDGFLMNGSLYSDVNSCNISAYAQYMDTGLGEVIVEDSYENFTINTDFENFAVGDYLKLKAEAPDGNLLDKGWRNRVRVDVSLDEERDDYPIEIEIGQGDVSDFTESDFEDLRVTYYDEGSNEEVEIPHWLQEKEVDLARIWAKVPEIDTSDTTLFIYYDNPEAEDASDAEEVFLFFDDFSDVDDWQAYGEGVSVRSEDGFLKFRNPAGMHRAWAVVDPGLDFDDFALEMRYRTVRSGQEVGPMIRIPDSPEVGEIEGYKFNIRGRDTNDVGIAQMQGMNDDGGGYNWLGHSSLGWDVDDSWYHGRLLAEGNSMQWFPNYYDRSSTFISYSHDSFDSGNIGLWQFDNSEMEVDWIFIRPRVSESTVEIIGHEENYKSQGFYISEEFLTVDDVYYDFMVWREESPSGTEVDVFVRTSADRTYWSDWYKQENNEEIIAPDRRYIQYMVNFTTGNTELTPEFGDLEISYYEADQSFSDMENERGSLRVHEGDNPYICGIMDDGDRCFPEWDPVTPMDRGRFNLRFFGEGDNCPYSEPSNEKLIYVFAETEIDNFVSDTGVAGVTEEIKLSGEFYDGRGNSLESMEIEFLNDGELLGIAETNAEGEFEFNYEIPIDWDFGEHTIVAHFPENYIDFYHSSFAETDITISSKPEINDIITMPSVSGNTETVEISANVTDEKGVDSVTVEIMHPDGETIELVDMFEGSEDDIYLAEYSNTWDEGIYYIEVRAENVDGIVSEDVSSFIVEIEGDANVFTDYGKYRNYREVNLDSRFEDIAIEEFETWESYSDWSLALSTGGGYDNVEIVDDTVVMEGESVEQFAYTETGVTEGGTGDWETYYSDVVDVSAMDDMYLFLEYAIESDSANRGSTSAGVRIMVDGEDGGFIEEVHGGDSDEGDIQGYWDVSGQDEVEVEFQFYSEEDGGHPPNQYPDDSRAEISEIRYDHTVFAGSGYFITEERDMGSEAKPRLTNLSYELNGGEIELEVVGSPDSPYEETKSLILDGEDEYDLNWNNGHDRFLVEVSFTSDDADNVPVMDEMSLEYLDLLEQEEIKSGFSNTGDTPLSGYRYSVVQRWDEEEERWRSVPPYVLYDKEGDGDKQVIEPGGFLEIEDDWSWHTSDHEPGVYRVRIALVDGESSPDSEDALIVDSEGNRLEAFYNFTIIEARLFTNELTYPHFSEYGLIEYETGEVIDWINLTLAARENTALDVYTNLSLLDRHSIGYAGFGPFMEEKYFGEIDVNETETRQWDNYSFGYPIGDDVVSETYRLNWDVDFDAIGGKYEEESVTWESHEDWAYPEDSYNIELVDGQLILDYDKELTGRYDEDEAEAGEGWQTYYEGTFDVTNMDEMYMFFDYNIVSYTHAQGSSSADVRVRLNRDTIYSSSVTDGNEEDGEWSSDIDVSDFGEVEVQFQYRAWEDSHADDGIAEIREAEHEYKSYKEEGYWETRFKGLAESKANLGEIVYELNNQEITIDVIGSPATGSEEVISVDLMEYEDGDELFWDNWHEEYAVRVNLTTYDESITPVFDALTLETSFFASVIQNLKVHNIPSSFDAGELERLYLGESTPLNFSLRNLWTSENLTSVSVNVNCPVIEGIDCICDDGEDVCTVDEISPLTTEWFDFDLMASDETPVGDYIINFTVEYTNPVGNERLWTEKYPLLLEIRERGLLEITRHYYDEKVIRGDETEVSLYATNTNTTSDDTNAWLAYTVVPDGWDVIEGQLNQSTEVIQAGEIIWNNATFEIQETDAGLGEKTMLANASADSAIPDFSQIFFDVYGRTNISQIYPSQDQVARGESVNITAQLTWTNGTVVEGETVYFYDETLEQIIGSSATNSSGYATIKYEIDPDSLLGSHTINATYHGNEDIYSLSSGAKTKIDVKLFPEILDIYHEPDIVGYGMDLIIDSDIMDDRYIDTAIINITYPDGSTKLDFMEDITPDSLVSWDSQEDWDNWTEKDMVEVHDGWVFMSGDEIRTDGFYEEDTNDAGNDEWVTYEEPVELDVTQMDEIEISMNYELNQNDGGAGVRITIDGDEEEPFYEDEETDGSFEWTGTLDVSDSDSVVIRFQSTSGRAGGANIDGEATIYWTEWEYMHLETEGYLLTDEKSSPNPAQPDLKNISYELNEGEIELEIIGSPGTGDEETITQELTGDNFYELDWLDTHNDFQISIFFTAEEDSILSPRFDSIVLEPATQNYQYVFNDTWFNGTYDYFIWANDTAGTEVQSSTRQFELKQDAELWFETNQTEYEQFSNVAIFQESEWWDFQWEYRQPITLSSGEPMPEGEQVLINLHDGNTGDNFNWYNECNDIRFVDSTHENKLDYSIINCSVEEENGEFIVEITESIDTEYTIYMYYKNTLAESVSSDFEDFNEDISVSHGDENERQISYGYPDMRGHTVMEVQRETSEGWETVETNIDQVLDGQFTESEENFINLSRIWNPQPWNTESYERGLYRIYAYMVSPYGDNLTTTGNDLIDGSSNFTILPPPVDVELNELRLYHVNESTRHAEGELISSGLDKTHRLFVNNSYRAEIDVEVLDDSNVWDMNLTLVNHTGLNEHWPMSQDVDIGFRIDNEEVVGGQFIDGNVHWDTENTSLYAEEGDRVIFFYAFNTTPDDTTGRYDVDFNLYDPRFTLYDGSTYDVVVEEIEPPSLFNETYNITEKEVIRNFNTTKVYARWDQDIENAQVGYDSDTEFLDWEYIDLPDPNPYNWTNYTLEPSGSWFLGEHRAKIEAKNPAGVWNDTLDYFFYTVYGLAYVEELSLNTTTPGVNESIEINCTVYDDSNSQPIEGYNASLYSYNENEGVTELIYNDTTDSNGMISYNYTPPTFGSYEISCMIPEEGYYKTDDRYVEQEEIFVLEFVPPWYDHVDGPDTVFKTQHLNTSSYWEDNAELLYGFFETNLSGEFRNETNMSISGESAWTNYSHRINESIIPGEYSWRHYAEDTSFNINRTPLQDFEVWGLAEVDEMQQEPTNMRLGNWTTSKCHVRDIHSQNSLSEYNVNFYRDGELLGANMTNETGWATYTFNASEVGTYDITCNITTQPEIYYEASENNEGERTINIVDSDNFYPPYLIEYGLNETEIMRGDSLKVYGQWNEEISHAERIFNMTSEFTQEYIEGPYEYNWTNTTLHINDSWDVGTRGVRFWANDTEGNINDSVPYLNFNVTGRSKVEWVEPTDMITHDVYDLTCRVADYDTNESIEGHSVQFYVDGDFKETVYTDEQGYASIEHDFSEKEYGEYDSSCYISDEGFYEAEVESDEETLIIEEMDTLLNIWDDSDIDQVFQYENVTFYANFTDADGSAIDGVCNITIENSTGYESFNMSFNNDSEFYEYNYSFVEKGVYDWNVTCDSLGSYPIHENDTVNISDGLPPEINLIYPEDGAEVDYNYTQDFTYNVTDQTGVESCSLIINDSINQTNVDITENTNQNFTVDKMNPGYYNWTVRCTDTSPQNNVGQAPAHDLLIEGSYLEMEWVEKPESVFRDEVHNFTVNISNTGVISANETNISLEIPSDWEFEEESIESYIEDITVGETLQFSWAVNITEMASFGNQTINSTSQLSVPGREDNISTVVDVLAINISVDEIISPENNSCTYDHLNASARISNLDNLSKDNITINLILNETLIESIDISLSEYETKVVDFEAHLLQNESRYNVTVQVDEPSDPYPENSKKTHFIDRFFRHIKSSYTMESLSDDNYRIQRTIENKKDCAIDSSYLAFSSEEFSFTDSSFAQTSTLSVNGGLSYLWQDNIDALGVSELVYNATGSGSYSVRNLYETGIAADWVE